MQQGDMDEFRDAIGALFAALGGETTQATFDGYWMGLSMLSIQEVQRAVVLAIASCRTIPKPVELRELVRGTDEDQAVIAWNDLQRAIPLGPYKHIDFANRTINAVVRHLGGWPELLSRMTDAEAEKWVRIEFIKTFKAMVSAGVDGEVCQPLAGLSQVCGSGGYVGEPVPKRIECKSQDLAKVRIGGGASVRRIETTLKPAY